MTSAGLALPVRAFLQEFNLLTTVAIRLGDSVRGGWERHHALGRCFNLRANACFRISVTIATTTTAVVSDCLRARRAVSNYLDINELRSTTCPQVDRQLLVFVSMGRKPPPGVLRATGGYNRDMRSGNPPINPARQVILCDESGHPTGAADMLAAHRGEGLLHLAFSVYVFSPDRRTLLIQQRSSEKMLWPLVWANTCCSHPRADEEPLQAGTRRLREEMGISCELRLGPAFVYRAVDPRGHGVEHEYDVILTGAYDADPTPDPHEVADWKWVEVDELERQMKTQPRLFAPWFHLGLPKARSTDGERA
jgi:isopentenyl-diphosphate Delta-isomerase